VKNTSISKCTEIYGDPEIDAVGCGCLNRSTKALLALQISDVLLDGKETPRPFIVLFCCHIAAVVKMPLWDAMYKTKKGDCAPSPPTFLGTFKNISTIYPTLKNASPYFLFLKNSIPTESQKPNDVSDSN